MESYSWTIFWEHLTDHIWDDLLGSFMGHFSETCHGAFYWQINVHCRVSFMTSFWTTVKASAEAKEDREEEN